MYRPNNVGVTFTVIFCCAFSLSWAAYDRSNTRRSAQNYVPQLMHTSENAELYTHRSPICLINRLAQKNNITFEYELINDSPPASAVASSTPKPHSYAYRLHLGSETYRATALTKTKSKDKVSREAYDKTHYAKPALKERTCLENGTRTIVSILYEFAAVNGTNIFDKEQQLSTMPVEFKTDLTVNRVTASGTGFSKKTAKKEAATKLVAMLGKDYVLREITKKFNDPEYIARRPVERLNLILAARVEPPARYSLNDEISDIGGITYMSRTTTETGDAVGTGRTLNDSRDDAASNLLKAMGFKV